MNQASSGILNQRKSLEEEKSKTLKKANEEDRMKKSSLSQKKNSPELRSHINSNISRNVSILSEFRRSRGDERSESKKKRRADLKSLSSRGSPKEAFISCLETSLQDIHEKQIFNDEQIKELSHDKIAQLAGTPFDPERFLRPTTNLDANLLERQLNAHKIVEYMVNYMTEYYDLNRDRNPFSEWREKLDEKLWDNFAYVIPLLCRQAVDDSLKCEPIIVSLMPDVLVFGDIHGNLNDIFYIYKKFLSDKKYSSYKFLFLGDYVDRGPKSMEVVIFLLACKLVEPKRYILLRGNHEVSKVNKKYGFKCLVEHIYMDTFKNKTCMVNLIYESFNRTFNYLPLASVIRYKDGQKGLFCCHGGIPNETYKADKKPWKISELNACSSQFKPHNLIPRKNCSGPLAAMNELLWNDPIPKTIIKKKDKKFTKLFYKNKKRGGHCSWFTEEAANRFLDANNLKTLIRGHQYRNCKEKGFYYHFSNQVLTIFSSSNYCGTEENVTGYVAVTEDSCRPMVLRTIEESKAYHNFNIFEVILDESTKKVCGVIF